MTTDVRQVRIYSTLAARFNASLTEDFGQRQVTWAGTVRLDTEDPMALEQCFRHFNRVTVEDDRRLTDDGFLMPSLSVGDFVQLDGKTYEVMPFGFAARDDFSWPA